MMSKVEQVGLDYAASWDGLARGDALHAICDGTDAASFEKLGREHAAKLAQLFPQGACVLDFGCGIGRIEKYLAPSCGELHGVDISAEMLARARTRLASFDNVHLHQLCGPALPMIPADSLEFAFAMLVFHHIAKEDALLILREFARVLAPGSRFFANFPNLCSPLYTGVFEAYAEQRERAAHRVRPYTEQEVRWLLERTGARIVEISVCDEIEVVAAID